MMLEERKTELAETLAQLQQQRGTALLDSGKVPLALNDKIVAAERELQAFEEASAEEVRRQRAKDAEAEAAHRAALKERMTAKKAALLSALERFEKAQREATTAIEDATAIAKDTEALMHELKPGQGYSSLRREMIVRLGGYVSLALGHAGGHPYRFGHVTINPTWGMTYKDSWYAAEHRRIEPIFKEFALED